MLQVKIKFRLNFLTLVDSQFPLSPSPKSLNIYRARRQRKTIENQPR